MGAKSRYLILILLLFGVSLYAQNNKDFNYVDSLTYSYYKSGNWDSLIKLGKEAIASDIDYKYLRQRLGYASFVQGNYSVAKHNFEKALEFDSFDQFSLEYLYYSFLNSGKEEFTGSIEKRLSPELKKSLSIKPFRPVKGIDFEYSYKFARTEYRSDPRYLRLGISTGIGYRLSLYQSVSGYKQEISTIQNGMSTGTSYTQPEYYVLLKWNPTKKLIFKGGYHFVNTISGTSSTYGNMFIGAVSTDFSWFSLEANGSIFDKGVENVFQAGAKGGIFFPGRSNFTLATSLSGLFHQNSNDIIFNQMAGIKLFRKVWLEGNVTFGSLQDYNDYCGLYLYNSYDPMAFRSGATLIYYAWNKVTLWGNYAYEKREYFENNSFYYNQFSFTGGIRWKL